MNPDSIWQKRKCIFLLTRNEKYGKKIYGYELEHFAEKIVLHSVMHLGQCGIQNYSVALCFSSFYDHKHYRCWRRIIEREQSKIASIPHLYKCTAEWMTIHSPKIIKQLWLVVVSCKANISPGVATTYPPPHLHQPIYPNPLSETPVASLPA